MAFGLWSFACSPKEVGKEFLDAAYEIGNFFSQASCDECIGIFVPEVKALKNEWSQLSEHDKGYRLGWIIGRYGVDVFLPLGSLKAVSKFRALKQANVLLTLEMCASSPQAKLKIIEQASIRGAQYKNVAKAVEQGRIAIRNANAACHILQPKHAWHKLIKITGNIEEDVKSFIAFLEKNSITDKAYRIGEPRLFPEINPKIAKIVHEKKIGDYIVHLDLETTIGSEIYFIKNGWIVTK